MEGISEHYRGIYTQLTLRHGDNIINRDSMGIEKSFQFVNGLDSALFKSDGIFSDMLHAMHTENISK